MKRLKTLQADIEAFARERDWGQFHTPKNLAMGIAVEAAEVLELFHWLTPEESRRLPRRERAKLADELADVYTYLLKLAAAYDIDLIEAARRKMRKNRRKYPVSKSRGLAKKYSELHR
ncbi:MAG: nucleotide pyrophosphohydrolase [Elusimicrobia bacterium]|nr:nucleotide pyrophosphohydrolase [Elusimicrobiota bacterium]